MEDFSRRLGPVGRPVDPDTYGAAFLGEAQVGGDVVAGNKILQLSPEQRTLPADISGFTGRDGILDQLDKLTDPDGPDTAIITAIHGMAGVGKTALAVHWAHQVADQFPDGQLYADMCGHASCAATPPATVLGRFLRALGVPDDRIPKDEAERAALFRSVLANRRVLIILDNVVSPQQVRPLLPGSRTCRTLVTSRNQLSSLVAQSGARTMAVDVLTADEATRLMITILGAGRVSTEPKAVGRLAQQCAYLPLALRIAAAHVAMGTYASITELADELSAGDRLAMLECDDDPHLAVRAAFDLSYRHLAESERRTFRYLGLIEGPDFTPPMVAALLDIPLERARRSLRTLVNAHLIEPKTAGRFRFHDLLREYARERIQDEEPAEVCEDAVQRIVTYYAKIATRLRPFFDPAHFRVAGQQSTAGSSTEGLTWFEAERANIIAATEQAARSQMWTLVWELAHATYDFLRQRRYSTENILLHRLGLKAARATGDESAETHMLHHLATLHMEIGRYDEAIKTAAKAL
jgi:hypothetical protein